MKFLTKIVLIVLFLGATLFSKDIATITALNGKAFIQRDGVKTEITLGYKLQEKDSIITGDRSKVQIIFEDETIVSLGKNSNFSISEYLYEDNQAPVAKFGILKGAMRTITGKIAKIAPDKFSVKTKTTTIGIRGTNFSIVIGDDGSQNVFCTYGAISVTINSVEHIVPQGFMIVVSPDKKVKVKEFTPQDLKEMKEKSFGKSEAKTGSASENRSASNNERQLDDTTEDLGSVVIQNISDSTNDSVQTSSNKYGTLTNSSVIAGYGMSNASYSGTYITTSNTTPITNNQFNDSGTATMDVDFGADSATLILEGGSSSLTFSSTTPVNTNQFSLENTNGATNSATASFYGDTGNIVKGNFDYTPDYNTLSKKAVGTYEVTSGDTLY